MGAFILRWMKWWPLDEEAGGFILIIAASHHRCHNIHHFLVAFNAFRKASFSMPRSNTYVIDSQDLKCLLQRAHISQSYKILYKRRGPFLHGGFDFLITLHLG